MRIYGLMYIRYHIGCMYRLMHIQLYAHMLPHILYIHSITCNYGLTCTYDLLVLQSYDLSYDVTPYGSNAICLSLYGLLCTCTTYTALWF